ncbi:MAG: 50S ribosomal protein L4, partial [Planctomycetes bacterium]|nr:50S ribosomal protein L4 [Planctomycetota bacterium]
DQTGKEVRKVDFDESIFGEKVLTKTLHQVVVAYGRNQRQGTHSTKTRSEVSGSRRKMWKQKGTGRARAGDKRPPHWRGGGMAHGPRPKDYYSRIPARLRHTALKSALLSKFRDGEVKVLDGVSLEAPQTKVVAGFLKGAIEKGSTLFALGQADENFYLSARNIQRTKVKVVREVNAYDIMRHGNLVLTMEALEALKAGVPVGGKDAE